MASCSKAPRGLFVLPREGRIFTATSISPRPPSRQRPDRDTFRAGRNLPDKEFRYLRTVIVTAAVYRGFGSPLARLPLTFRHWAGVSPHTSPRGLAETCVCVKQSPGPGHCGPLGLRRRAPSPYAGHPFSRSYGVNLPSSLTEVPSPTWGSSPCPPVSVCGTVARTLASGFSGSPRPMPLGRGRTPASPSPLGQRPRVFPPRASLPASTPSRTLALPHEVPASLITDTRGTGLITRSPSPTARALGLGPPHPQRMNRAAEPSGIRWGGFSPPSRYSYRHSHSRPLHRPSPGDFAADRDAPLPARPPKGRPRGFGAGLEPRWILGAGAHRPVSYYALFQGWLLLSQPPGCLRAPTAFPTEPGLRDLSRRSGLFPSRR